MSSENIEKDIEKIKGKIQEISDLDQIENLVMSNVVEFDHKDIRYKVRKPTFREKQEVNQKRIIKYTEFLKDDKLVLEKDLIELYKKRGIDIKEMDDKQDSLNKSRNDLLLKLGKAITEKSPELDLKIYRDEINRIFSEQQELIIK